MHLVYIDESGNSGNNLSDPQQPVFTLCGMIVAEENWQPLERDLVEVLDRRMPDWRDTPKFEIHAADLRSGTGIFRKIPVSDRIALRDEWMEVGKKNGIKLVHRNIRKSQYAKYCHSAFGAGIQVNPHLVAFAMLSRCIDNYLESLNANALGILIFDDNKEIFTEIEHSIRELRAFDGKLRLSRIIEKGFFIDSTKSLPLQLCDLFAITMRKRYERANSITPPKTIDDSAIAAIDTLLYNDPQNDFDMISWATESAKKKRPGGSPGVA